MGLTSAASYALIWNAQECIHWKPQFPTPSLFQYGYAAYESKYVYPQMYCVPPGTANTNIAQYEQMGQPFPGSHGYTSIQGYVTPWSSCSAIWGTPFQRSNHINYCKHHTLQVIRVMGIQGKSGVTCKILSCSKPSVETWKGVDCSFAGLFDGHVLPGLWVAGGLWIYRLMEPGSRNRV